MKINVEDMLLSSTQFCTQHFIQTYQVCAKQNAQSMFYVFTLRNKVGNDTKAEARAKLYTGHHGYY